MDTTVFGDFTVKHLVIAIVALVALVGLYKLLFARKEEESFVVPAECKCGWKGNVSKFTRKCPKCNATIPGPAAGGASR